MIVLGGRCGRGTRAQNFGGFRALVWERQKVSESL